MDYTKYNQIQTELGGIADTFRSSMHQILTLSNASEETKELVKKTCDQLYTTLNEMAVLISRTAELFTK